MNRDPSVASLTDAKLARALLDHCRWDGLSWGDEAALRLLIAQGTWLARDEFRRHVHVEIRAVTANRTAHHDSHPEPDRDPDLADGDVQTTGVAQSGRQLLLGAWVDWRGVAEEPDHSAASSGESGILRLACHLAGQLPIQPEEPLQVEWTLAGIFMPLDATTALLATRAVAMAAIGPDAVGPLQ